MWTRSGPFPRTATGLTILPINDTFFPRDIQYLSLEPPSRIVSDEIACVFVRIGVPFAPSPNVVSSNIRKPAKDLCVAVFCIVIVTITPLAAWAPDVLIGVKIWVTFKNGDSNINEVSLPFFSILFLNILELPSL